MTSSSSSAACPSSSSSEDDSNTFLRLTHSSLSLVGAAVPPLLLSLVDFLGFNFVTNANVDEVDRTDEVEAPPREVRDASMEATSPVLSLSFPLTDSVGVASSCPPIDTRLFLVNEAGSIVLDELEEERVEAEVAVEEGEETESNSEGEELIFVGRNNPETRRVGRALLIFSAIVAEVEADGAVGGKRFAVDRIGLVRMGGGEGDLATMTGGVGDEGGEDSKEYGGDAEEGWGRGEEDMD